MRTLSLRSVPDAYSQCTHQFLTRMISMFLRDLLKVGNFMLMLSIRVRNWYVCSGRISSWSVCSANASIPDPGSGTNQFLMQMLSIFLMDCALCTHYIVPNSYAQCTHHWSVCIGLRTFLDYRLAAKSIGWDCRKKSYNIYDELSFTIKSKSLYEMVL